MPGYWHWVAEEKNALLFFEPKLFLTALLDLDLRFRFFLTLTKKYVPHNTLLKYNLKCATKDTKSGSLLKQAALTNTNFDVQLPCAVQELNQNEKEKQEEKGERR